MAKAATKPKDFWNEIVDFEEAKESLFSGDFRDVISLNAANDNIGLFGVDFSDLEEKTKSLFRMRKRGNLDDHLNRDIIAQALVGFLNMEWGPYGMPVKLYDISTMCELIALYSNSAAFQNWERNLKGSMPKDFSGLPYWEQVPKFVRDAYIPGKTDGNAMNALIALRKSGADLKPREEALRKAVYTEFNASDVAQYYRTLHIPKAIRRDFPPVGMYSKLGVIPFDERFSELADSSELRNSLAEAFLSGIKMREAYRKPELNGHFRSWLVASEKTKGNFYQVEENMLQSGKLRYDCSCPYVLFNLQRTTQAKDPCKHINAVKALDVIMVAA